jgi:hypothetical protein
MLSMRARKCLFRQSSASLECDGRITITSETNPLVVEETIKFKLRSFAFL